MRINCEKRHVRILLTCGLTALGLGSLISLAACMHVPFWSPSPLASLERIEGWIPYWVDGESVTQEAVAAGFTDLLLFHGTVDAQGRVLLEEPERLQRAMAYAAGADVRTWLTVTNHGRSLEGALGSGRLEAHVESLLEAFHASECQHLDLDYESMTTAQAMQLPELARMLEERLDETVKLSFTLQPVDNRYRPDQQQMVRELLEMSRVETIRFMMYDYAWRNSLPGALCPVEDYERLLRLWYRYADKLTICLPLYGYDWPRPLDATLPRAETVFLRDVPDLPAAFYWMRAEREMAARYTKEGVNHMVAVPSLRAAQERVETALDYGVPAIAYWHLGAAELAPVVRASRRGRRPREAIAYREIDGWDTWVEPYRALQPTP